MKYDTLSLWYKDLPSSIVTCIRYLTMAVVDFPRFHDVSYVLCRVVDKTFGYEWRMLRLMETPFYRICILARVFVWSGRFSQKVPLVLSLRRRYFRESAQTTYNILLCAVTSPNILLQKRVFLIDSHNWDEVLDGTSCLGPRPWWDAKGERGRVKLKSLFGGKSEMIPGRDSREEKSLVVVVYHTAM